MNPNKVDEALKTAGFFAFITNRRDLESSELLTIYQQKEGVEKNFHHLKE